MSDNIFAEIYNKILGLFGQSAKDESKNTAVNRLRLVLMQDRTNLTPEIMHRMRTELIEVLSKYVELDKEALDLNFEQEGEQMALMLSIPVIRAKDEAEIEEALKKEQEEKDSEDEETKDSNETEKSESDDENAEEEDKSETFDEEEKSSDESEEEKETTEEEDDKKDEIEEEEIEQKPIPTIKKTPKAKAEEAETSEKTEE